MKKIGFTRSTVLIIIVLLVIAVTGVFITAVLFVKEPTKIGFSATLTGGQAELGVQERNGVLLAIDEINAAGGINGHPIELVIRDDLGTPDGAKDADRDLIKTGVIAIIGHATSSQTLAGLDITNASDVILLSPTTSTDQLTNLDDLFFRAIASHAEWVKGFADYLIFKQNITQIAIIYDTDNAAFSNSYLKNFKEKYEADGGKVVNEANFSSIEQPDFRPVLSGLLTSKAQGLLIIAADIDTALIAQRTRQMDLDIPIFSSGWAQTQTLINNGGAAVEGLILELSFPLNSQDPAFIRFNETFTKRFGRTPSYGAAYGYESVKILALALEKTNGTSSGLKEALLGIQNFHGLVDTISFNPYGDIIRPVYLGIIENSSYREIGLEPPPVT